ncbi:hypothetical protein [Herbaspirillum sp.]|uniref:hypothetical protein n=1 Tax=Herbaspirillum sp. TaxID=1890675 RepID=UPI00258CFEC4|nr:hypothetical protein [Herbaspirillum sp.]MCP3947328.1 hypothetical protein [Herbaspirillum sp.]
MTITITKQQVRGMIPADYVYKTVSNRLPGGDDTPFAPSEMAELGVPHNTIVWSFIRPAVLEDAFGETVCKIAEAALPAFEAARPDDTGPRDAIEAARKCFASPTADNRAAAHAAAVAAALADANAAYTAAVDDPSAASWAPWESRAASAAASSAASYAARVLDEYNVPSASETANLAVDAGCPPAKIISIIEGARI